MSSRRASRKSRHIRTPNSNAAVEAARAGEHGAGVAVVADAVRSLAHRSASAADEISDLIREVVERADAGRALARNGERALHEIVASTRSLSEFSRHIEQAAAVAQISASVGDLDADGQQNAVVARQVVASAEEFDVQASALCEAVEDLQLLVEGKVATSSEPIEPLVRSARAPALSVAAPRNSSMGARGRGPARNAKRTPSWPSHSAPSAEL